jgi:hypothetical protein
LNPDISQKYKMGDISEGVAKTLARQKKIQKKFQSEFPLVSMEKESLQSPV